MSTWHYHTRHLFGKLHARSVTAPKKKRKKNQFVLHIDNVTDRGVNLTLHSVLTHLQNPDTLPRHCTVPHNGNLLSLTLYTENKNKTKQANSPITLKSY